MNKKVSFIITTLCIVLSMMISVAAGFVISCAAKEYGLSQQDTMFCGFVCVSVFLFLGFACTDVLQAIFKLKEEIKELEIEME